MSIKIMVDVWKSNSTSGSDRLVLLALADSANDDGYCWPSYDTIAEKANLGKRYVIMIVEKLEKAGLVKKSHRFKDGEYTSNLYQVVVNNTSPEVVNHSSLPSEQDSTTLVNYDSLKPSFNRNETSTRERRTDAKVKGDLFDGMLAYANLPSNDLSWLPEHLKPLAESFIDASGIIPTKADRKSWIAWISEQYEMQIRPEQIRRAVTKLLHDGMTIGGPVSVTKTARSLKMVKAEVFTEEYR